VDESVVVKVVRRIDSDVDVLGRVMVVRGAQTLEPSRVYPSMHRFEPGLLEQLLFASAIVKSGHTQTP
jgi:hypothetical protein